MTRVDLAHRAVLSLAKEMGRELVERADPAQVPMTKTVCLGKTPIARFVVHENTLYWAPIEGREE